MLNFDRHVHTWVTQTPIIDSKYYHQPQKFPNFTSQSIPVYTIPTWNYYFVIFLEQISFACSRTSYKWSHTVFALLGIKNKAITRYSCKSCLLICVFIILDNYLVVEMLVMTLVYVWFYKKLSSLFPKWLCSLLFPTMNEDLSCFISFPIGLLYSQPFTF